MEVDFPASLSVRFTQFTMMSSFAFWPSPRSSRTLRVYLRESAKKVNLFEEGKCKQQRNVSCTLLSWRVHGGGRDCLLGKATWCLCLTSWISFPDPAVGGERWFSTVNLWPSSVLMWAMLYSLTHIRLIPCALADTYAEWMLWLLFLRDVHFPSG